MKKVVVALVLCVAMLGILAAPALAGASMGAVKLALHQRTGSEAYGDVGLGPQVGWAIANTNANGKLIIETHLDNGAPDLTFDVYVKINGSWLSADVGQLTTNPKGKGNAHAVLNIADYPPSTGTINVQVVVKAPPYTPAVNYSTATEPVQLKK